MMAYLTFKNFSIFLGFLVCLRAFSNCCASPEIFPIIFIEKCLHVDPCSQTCVLHTGLQLLSLPNLGQWAGAYLEFVVLAVGLFLDDLVHYSLLHLSPGSCPPTGSFSTFITANWGMWAFFIPCIPYRAQGNKDYLSVQIRASYLPPITLLLR